MIQELKLPYQLFVASGQSPLHVLSWRLRTDESARLPKAWILLLGTSPKGSSSGKMTLGEVGFEFGVQLVETEYGIVTGVSSYDIQIQVPFNLGFARTFREKQHYGNIKDYMRHYRFEIERVVDPELENATKIFFLANDMDRLNECLTSYPNAAVLIGGKDDDLQLAMACIRHGRPVFPIVESGGAAKQFYDLLLQNYSEGVKETSVFGTNINLKTIYQHPLDVEALDRPYRSAIAEIISHLNMIYTPDDPRMYSFE